MTIQDYIDKWKDRRDHLAYQDGLIYMNLAEFIKDLEEIQRDLHVPPCDEKALNQYYHLPMIPSRAHYGDIQP